MVSRDGVSSNTLSICCAMHAWSVVSDSFRPRGMQPTRFLCPWNFPGKNNEVSCHFLLQGIFRIQGLNLCLLHLLHWRHLESCTLSMFISVLHNTFHSGYRLLSVPPAQGLTLIDPSLPIQRPFFQASFTESSQLYDLLSLSPEIAPYLRIFKWTKDAFFFTFPPVHTLLYLKQVTNKDVL